MTPPLTLYPTDAEAYEVPFEAPEGHPWQLMGLQALEYQCWAKSEAAALRCIQACALTTLTRAGIRHPSARYLGPGEE